MAIEIVDLSLENGDFSMVMLHVSLPEGKNKNRNNSTKI
jgi:hypothetical protein